MKTNGTTPNGTAAGTVIASLRLRFTTDYISHPYTIDVYNLIEITKKSGLSRAKSEANRRKALDEHLRANGMTLAEFEALKRRAEEAFRRDDEGFIILPEDSVMAFLVATNDEARAAQKFCAPGQVRSRIRGGDFVTDRKEKDGDWRRFATVSSGVGAKLSNQRGLRVNAMLAAGATARGALKFDSQMVDPETLRKAIAWGGDMIGIGASRKMGKGRFVVEEWEISPWEM